MTFCSFITVIVLDIDQNVIHIQYHQKEAMYSMQILINEKHFLIKISRSLLNFNMYFNQFLCLFFQLIYKL